MKKNNKSNSESAERRKALLFRLAPLLVLLIGCVLLYSGRHLLTMGANYAFEALGFVGFGPDGQTLVIDEGRRTLEELDGRRVLTKRRSGEDAGSFYYADLAARDDRYLYIADTAYTDVADGSLASVRRVLELDGNRQRVVWQGAVSNGNTAANRILELQVCDGQVWFLLAVEYGMELYRFAPGGAPSLAGRYYNGDRINSASVDTRTGAAAIAVRRGYVRYQAAGSDTWRTLESDAAHLMPQSITFRNGRIWFTDLYAGRVCSFDTVQPEHLETVYTAGDAADAVPVCVHASEDGSRVLVGLPGGFVDIAAGESAEVRSVRFASFPLTVCLWAVALLTVLALMVLLRYALVKAQGTFANESSLRVLIVVLASVTISGFVGYSLLNESFSWEDDALIENMRLFAGIASDSVDTASLRMITGERDYGGSAYTAVRDPLTHMMELARAEGRDYRSVLYNLDGGTLRFVCSSDDSSMCGEPYAGPDADYLREVIRSGTSYALRLRDVDGNWLCLLVPVRERTGTSIAALKLTMDMGIHSVQRREAVFSTILNMVCTTAVVVMLILEGVFLLTFFERHRSRNVDRSDGPTWTPVRTMMFFSYLVYAMQEPFLAVLCANLYQGGLPLPDEVARALPISAQMLFMAVASAFAGSAAEKSGTQRVLLLGVFLQLGGVLCCLGFGNYFGFLVGESLLGAGMGVVYVTSNTVAASASSVKSSQNAFAGIAAGTIAGLTVGAGLSSVFLSIGGWRLVLALSDVLLLPALVLAHVSGNSRSVRTEKAEGDAPAPRGGRIRFLFRRRIIVFFLMILVPFTMAASYRVVFFPTYAADLGVNDVRIGQVYLLGGLLVLYLGPRLSAAVLRSFGAFRGVLVATLVAGLGMLLFVLFPTLGSVIVGVVVIYGSYAFGSACQYSYFQQLPECLSFGSGRSMSMFSVFESLGQTFGPMAFSVLIALGYRNGVAIFAVGLLGLGVLFALLSLRGQQTVESAREEGTE